MIRGPPDTAVLFSCCRLNVYFFVTSSGAEDAAVHVRTNSSFFMKGVHANNYGCTYSWYDENGCRKCVETTKSLHIFSEGLTCEKLDVLEEDGIGGFEHRGRKVECIAGNFSGCRFGEPTDIPTDCSALNCEALRHVGWLRLQHQVMTSGNAQK